MDTGNLERCFDKFEEMKTSLSEWFKLTDANKRNIFAETARQKALPVSSIEVDYTKHAPEHIRIVPPENLLPLWEKDYESMINSMVYGKKLSFNELILRIYNVQKQINKNQL